MLCGMAMAGCCKDRNDVFAEAERFVAALKEWLLEIRMRCEETEDPEECHRTVRQLDERIKRFERIMELRKYWDWK